MLRLHPASRNAAIVIFVNAILNSLLMVLLPGLQGRLAVMYSAFPGLQRPETPLVTAVPPILIGMIFSAIPLWFLIARRAAFEPPLPSPAGFEPQGPPPLPPDVAG